MRLLDDSGRRSPSGALMLCAAGVAALGLFAAFANASPLGHISSGERRPKLSLTPRHVARIAALAPGDHAERTVELRYRGRGRFAVVVLSTRSRGSRLLGSALRLRIERCSRRWAKQSATRSYRCRGKRWTVLKTARIRGRRRVVLRHLSRRPGRADHLRLTFSLPRVAGNELQGQTSRLAYRFTGVARG